MDYKDFFKPETLANLNKKSAESLKTMLGNQNLMQATIASSTLMDQFSKVEAPYKDKLERLAVGMVKELYPIIDDQGIQIDAKLGTTSDITRGLDEAASPEASRRVINGITQGAALRGTFLFFLFKEHLDDLDPTLIGKYNQIMKNVFGVYDDENAIAMMLAMIARGQKTAGGLSKVKINEIKVNKPNELYSVVNSDLNIDYDNLIRNIKIHKNKIQSKLGITDIDKLNKFLTFYINCYTEVEHQGDEELYVDMSLNDFLEDIEEMYKASPEEEWAPDPEYDVVTINDILESNLSEAKSRFTIEARAANFPMLVHELIKGVYEVISLQGFKGDKASNQAVVDKVDLLKNEPDDLRYGKFIYDALNKVFVNSEYNDPRIREFFFIDVYQLSNEEFLEFVENAVNEELTAAQIRWANNTLREINDDLKADDYDATGLSEITVNSPDPFERLKKNLIKLIEYDKTNSYYDDQEVLIYADYTIDSLKAAKNEDDLKLAMHDYCFGETAIIQHYFNLANYKIKDNNPLINEITVNPPDPFKRLQRNLIKLIEDDKKALTPIDVDDVDLEALEDADDTINSLRIAKNESDLRIALDQYHWGDSANVQYYFDLANYKIKDNNPLISEIKVNPPFVDPKRISLGNARKELEDLTGKEISPLNLKLGKYNISGNEQGTELTWEEGSKLLSSTTRQNVISFFNNILNIEPSKIYIGIVPRDGKAAKSFYIAGEYNNIPIIVARKETAAPGAGQTHLISPSYKDKFHNYSNQHGIMSNEEIKQKVVNNFGLNLNEIKISTPNKKLNITFINKGYGLLYFRDNDWFGKETWDKYTQNHNTLFAYPYKDYTYISSHDYNEGVPGAPIHHIDKIENHLNEFKQYLAAKGIPSQLVKWYDLPRLKIERRYYNLLKSDGTPLDEIKVNAPSKPIGSEKNDMIRDEIVKQLKGIILDVGGTYLTFLLETNPQIHDLLYQFVKEQMVFNNYEILRNGEETLVTFNNQNLVKEQDIIDYIDEHPELEKFLETITWSFYFDNVNFDSIFAECVRIIKSEGSEEDTSKYHIEFLVNDVLLDSPLIYPEDLFYEKQNEFEDYLTEKFKNSDLMNEIKVNEPGISAQIIKKYIKNNVDPSNMDHVRTLSIVNGKYFDTNNVTTKMIDSMSPKKMAEYFSILKKRLETQSLTEAYSEGTINKTIERWKTTNPNTDETLAKQLIQRFDQVKAGLASKLDVVVLPDELKQGQNYLNIDKYSFDDMVKLIRSVPENPDKVKKDAIAKFVQQDGIDRNTAQSYVARFMQVAKRGDLKYALENGTENGAFSKEEVKDLIPKRLLASNTYLDPRAWTWQPFEQILDALFPSQKAAGDEGENLASTDADKVYNKNGIEIYKGDDIDKCISYNPVNPDTKRKKYGWCVTTVGNTNYDYYRFGSGQLKSPTFYFIFDRSKDSSPEHYPFKDIWHAFVIQVDADSEGYVVSDADNRGDKYVKSWEKISTLVPSDTWAKIKDLKDYFKPIALSDVERGRKFAAGKDLSLDEFKELSQDEKELYIQGKASKNQISNDILKVLPQYKIDYEGRSTTLANVAIDSGQKFPYFILKDNEALAKRYAIFRTRQDHPIPLPFIKYLDDKSKQTYLDRFTEDNLTFDYLEKFFGETATQKYVNDQIKKLDYLPKEAIKYITDPKIKRFYEMYTKLYSNWSVSNEKLINMDDDELGNISSMPKLDINPAPMNLKQWQDLSSTEKKLTIELAEKYNQNLDYSTLIYALPFVIKDGSKTYVLVPATGNDYFYNNWALADLNGNVVKEISGNSMLGLYDLVGGYPSANDNYKRVWNINDLKVK